MPRLQFLMFLIILSCLLTGCSLSLPPPSAPKLMAVFTEPFLCGFTFYEPDAKPLQASLVRNASGDLLTVYGEHANTVLFHDGTALTLRTSGNEDTPPLQLPLPTGYDQGAAASFALFSVVPDDSFSSSHGDGGILVTSPDGSYTAVFSSDGIPQRITSGNRCAVITSFTANPPPTT